jgi:hypothetical protein
MSITYEIAVRFLGCKNTHLKLRERAKLALQELHRANTPLPDDFMQCVNRAIYLRRNAYNYEQQHFPGWQDIPVELRDSLKENYPMSGYGMSGMNTLLYLQRQAEEAEAEITLPPLPELPEIEVDKMIQDYLAWRDAHKRTN